MCIILLAIWMSKGLRSGILLETLMVFMQCASWEIGLKHAVNESIKWGIKTGVASFWGVICLGSGVSGVVFATSWHLTALIVTKVYEKYQERAVNGSEKLYIHTAAMIPAGVLTVVVVGLFFNPISGASLMTAACLTGLCVLVLWGVGSFLFSEAAEDRRKRGAI